MHPDVVECFVVEQVGGGLLEWECIVLHMGCPAAPSTIGRAVSTIGVFADADKPHLHDDGLPWPTACGDCGATIERDSDEFSVSLGGSHRFRLPGGSEMRVAKLPAGAMWLADPWYEGEHTGPDGKVLRVVLPCGHVWEVDREAASGGHWERSGVPPVVTANPSIFCRCGEATEYHGWLRAGKLERC